MSEALIVFAKPPVAGQVKTRLQSVLTSEEAARLYGAFLADSLDRYRTLGCDVYLYFTEMPAAEMEGVDLSWLTVCRQEGADLAERLRRAFVHAFGLGYGEIVVIGTDHPSLPVAFVEHAFHQLRRPLSITIGPTEDGGYYLLGMSDFFPILFEEMRYSHSRVFEDTMDRATSTRAEVSVLPMWYDVDTPEQLPRLQADLREVPSQAPRSLEVVEALLGKYGFLSGAR